jgi:chromatin segregation and condensation protein Rec8/ScpA/Scc1 (kleisin family)
MIDRLKERVEKQFHFNFNDFAEGEKERSTVIVGFLAVLELVKQGNLLVRQTARFHEIHIERSHSTAPRYQ